MSQYQGLFNASRIPELEKDRIHRVQTSKHLLVMKDGSFYTIDVLDDDGNIREPSYIMTQLKFVLSRNETENKNPIGALTTENRDNWARTRKYFESLSSRNRSNFELIDSAIFCLCLDNTSINEDNPIETIRSFLFDECKNRWYDKSLSVIVNKTTAGINFEHSWGDGVAVLRYFNELYKEISTKPFINPSTQPINIDYEHTIKRLDFDIDARIENDIKIANEKHENIVKSIDMNFLRYGELNKNECKKYKCSPDAMMQLSFQMAYFKQYQV
jgi:carnitine O-palmitoyltransferase 2